MNLNIGTTGKFNIWLTTIMQKFTIISITGGPIYK